MDGPELTAFVPLDEGVARRKHWPMPARTLYQHLVEKTRGRVVQSDKAPKAPPVPGVTAKALYVEISLPARPLAEALSADSHQDNRSPRSD